MKPDKRVEVALARLKAVRLKARMAKRALTLARQAKRAETVGKAFDDSNPIECQVCGARVPRSGKRGRPRQTCSESCQAEWVRRYDADWKRAYRQRLKGGLSE